MKRFKIVMPIFLTLVILFGNKTHAQKAQADSLTKDIKRNMHTVQLTVEDYAHRHGGIYPSSVKDVITLLPKIYTNPCNTKLPAVADGKSDIPGQAMYIYGGPNKYTVLGNDERGKRMEFRLVGSPVNRTVIQKPLKEVAKNTASEEDSMPGKYVKKVLIKAKWGDGPGEFQLMPINETHSWIAYLALDKQGNIYIVDQNNYRVNVYNNKGKFQKVVQLSEKDRILITGIGVDSRGHIFITSSAPMSGQAFIEINRKNDIIDKFELPGVWVGLSKFSEDSEGNIYVRKHWTDSISIPLSLASERKDSKDVINKIKEVKLLKYYSKETINKYGLMATQDNSGNIFFKNEKGKIVFMKRQYDIVDIHSFSYKKYDNIMATARAAFDDDGKFYIVQGTTQGLQVLKCTPQFEELK
jgi:hypothetical protein